MKTRFLPWFLFILCTQSVAILGFESFPRSKTEDFNLSKPRFGGQLHGVNVTNGFYGEIERMGLEGKQEILDSVKGQRGKGTNGGGNPARHPRSSKGIASLSSGPRYLVSAATPHVILALMGLSLPYFLTGF
ncbi:hypothetical protein WN943_022803 [Citrus x changshan-huyou]|uniref:Uncharacterized protein n=1 Tax=Citrus unshiu TaxID=55188 RepID=A0A2H5PSW5_CITUN|nr:hypothetical protein CUMW_164270 [Citrus unshiu]